VPIAMRPKTMPVPDGVARRAGIVSRIPARESAQRDILLTFAGRGMERETGLEPATFCLGTRPCAEHTYWVHVRTGDGSHSPRPACP